MISTLVCHLDEQKRPGISILRQFLFILYKKWGKRCSPKLTCKNMAVNWDLIWRSNNSHRGPLDSPLHMQLSEVLQKHCKALIHAKNTSMNAYYCDNPILHLQTNMQENIYHGIKKCTNPYEVIHMKLWALKIHPVVLLGWLVASAAELAFYLRSFTVHRNWKWKCTMLLSSSSSKKQSQLYCGVKAEVKKKLWWSDMACDRFWWVCSLPGEHSAELTEIRFYS